MQMFIVHSPARSDQYTVNAPDILRDSVSGRVVLRGKGQTTVVGKTKTSIHTYTLEVYVTEDEILAAAAHVRLMQEARITGGSNV